MDKLSIEINRLLLHLKTKPTHFILNTIYIILKNNGYNDIPRLHLFDCNFIDRKVILNYCKEIEYIIQKGSEVEERKKNSTTKEIYMFPESSMLPQNVYVSEKKDEEKLEENYIEEDISSESESENSAGSEFEYQEEGYDVEFYDGEESEFSE